MAYLLKNGVPFKQLTGGKGLAREMMYALEIILLEFQGVNFTEGAE